MTLFHERLADACMTEPLFYRDFVDLNVAPGHQNRMRHGFVHREADSANKLTIAFGHQQSVIFAIDTLFYIVPRVVKPGASPEHTRQRIGMEGVPFSEHLK